MVIERDDDVRDVTMLRTFRSSVPTRVSISLLELRKV